MERKAKYLTLVECAIMLALATALSFVKIFALPLGGSVTLLSMLPIVLVSVKHGVKTGFATAGLYGVIQMLIGSDFNVASLADTVGVFVVCILFDYILAFGVLGIAGIRRHNGLIGQEVGILLAVFLRFVCHYISGVTIWASYAPEGLSAGMYSLMYNGTYMLPECIFTMIGAVALLKAPYVRTLFRIKEAA
ncbi:energy-coupled thiamine transporter ThiT [Clostridia bacterium]|nr:energy-coupled thiamine transporter ThiT [Clostridia bacterium]